MLITEERQSVYQPEQDGLIFPQEPTFDSPLAERQHRKERLAAACRLFARRGFSFGFGGHLTVRDTVDPELFWTNPMCVPFSQVSVSNLVLVNHSGKVVEGKYAINRAGYVLHAEIHRQNPEVVASCHAHTVHGAAWAAMGRPLDPTTQDACSFYGDHAVVRDRAGKVPVEDDAGVAIAKAFRTNKAVIHQNHGLLTGSRHSIDDAAWQFYALDHVCRVQLLIDAADSKPVAVEPEFAKVTNDTVGTSYIGWLHFQVLFAEISKEEPDLFD